jgi:hypothetical protein
MFVENCGFHNYANAVPKNWQYANETNMQKCISNLMAA